MPRLCILLLVVISLVAAARPQSPADSAGAFDIRLKGAVIGHEDYKIVATKQGFTLSSSIQIKAGGRSVAMQQEQTLSPSWGLLHYTLKADPQQATIEAWKDGDKAQMRIQVGGQTPSKTADLLPRTLVIDNNVPSHFQVLLNQFALTPEDKSQQFQLLVPQVLLPIKVTVAITGTDQGTLDGKNVKITRYQMTFGEVTSDFWADGQGRLMRVAQTGTDSVRSGFEMADSSATPPASSAGTGRQLTFPSGDLQVPATLLLPEPKAGRKAEPKNDKVPLVVLVCGSGPHDRDETVGPNKPFLDIAQGLAAKGIATLRYDKRTFAFKDKIDLHSLTVQEEVIDDAVAALRYARTLPQVDPGNVFLLGHSQGAELSPFILQQDPPTRGAILMATPGRPLDQIVLEQLEFQGWARSQQEAAAAQINLLKPKFAAIRDGTLSDSEIVLNAPVIYWRDLFKRDQMAAIHHTKAPLLVLQGGRDVQVLAKDYDLVTAAVPPALLEKHLFPDLNHLFMTTKPGATGEEILTTPGHVAPEVIDAIAAWIVRKMGPDTRNWP